MSRNGAKRRQPTRVARIAFGQIRAGCRGVPWLRCGPACVGTEREVRLIHLNGDEMLQGASAYQQQCGSLLEGLRGSGGPSLTSVGDPQRTNPLSLPLRPPDHCHYGLFRAGPRLLLLELQGPTSSYSRRAFLSRTGSAAVAQNTETHHPKPKRDRPTELSHFLR
jgi:hypothetical protein